MPFGLMTPASWVAMFTQRYMHETGCTSLDLAEVAISTRKHAVTNPNAFFYQRPLTVEEHQTARFIAEPLRLYDCCQETDGGCACILVSAERARDLRQKPALVHAVAQASGPNPVHLANYNNTPAMETTSVFCAQTLWRRSELQPKDMDCAQIYDAFTPLVILSLIHI